MTGLLRRKGVMLGDQALSSLAHVLAIVLVARALSASEFGHFMLAYAVLTLVLGVSRSYLGTQISLATTNADARAVTAAALGTLVWLSPVIVVGVAATALALSPGTSLSLAAVMGVATLLSCLQDVGRFGASASGRAWAAFASDLVWLLVVAAPLVLGRDLSATSAVTVWLAAAVAATVVVVVALRAVPNPRAGADLLRTRHRVGESMALGTVMGAGAMLLVLSAATRIIDSEAVAGLRGAATLMGPINVVLAFLHIGLTPSLVRRPRSADVRACTVVAGAVAALVLAWSVTLLLLPDGWGTALLGETWEVTRPLLGWTGAEYVLLATAAAATLGLKVRHQSRALVRQKAWFAAVTLVAGLAGAMAVRDAWGVSAGLVLAAAVASAMGWAALRKPWTEPTSHPAADAEAPAIGVGNDGRQR